MVNRNFLVNGAVAFFAAIAGSCITLLLAGNLGLLAEQQSASEPLITESDLKASVDNSSPVALAEGNVDSLAMQETMAQLEEELQGANAARAQLAQSVALLDRQVDALESDVINLGALLSQSETTEPAAQGGMPMDTNTGGFARETDAEERFDSLLAAGVDQLTADQIQATLDQYQLERLELFDLAEREGWIETDQFSDRLEELEEQQPDLRAELGDAAYDRYLYELGRSNRVIISSVISGSAAQDAGLQNGDVIMAYANERVFSSRDLQAATRAGLKGESVAVSFERDGQFNSAQIPRGPLGITLSMISRKPS